ncbi:MAG TPA: hypothetical protein VN648_12590 [Candidatus Methylomirabilis sp.]|nr:hypothetical protein [Candidatus Methylomirabilis sp.]
MEEGLRLCPIEDRWRLDSPREGMLKGFSLRNYQLLVDYAGRFFPEGKAVISAELGAILRRLGSSAENWQARLRRLASGRLLRRFFAATQSRLREVAQRLGVHRLANLAGCAARRGGLSPKAVSRLKVPRVARPRPVAVPARRKGVFGRAAESSGFSHLGRIELPFTLIQIARDRRSSERWDATRVVLVPTPVPPRSDACPVSPCGPPCGPLLGVLDGTPPSR